MSFKSFYTNIEDIIKFKSSISFERLNLKDIIKFKKFKDMSFKSFFIWCVFNIFKF